MYGRYIELRNLTRGRELPSQPCTAQTKNPQPETADFAFVESSCRRLEAQEVL